jgi:TRAP-type mannitol/chloroaromatic compound transport system permease small subunit
VPGAIAKRSIDSGRRAVIDSLLQATRHCARIGTWFGGGLIFLGAILVSIDVVLRKLFALTLGGADEMSGYALAIGSAWAFAFALLERVNVRVDAVYQRFSPSIAGLFDLLALLALSVFVMMVTWFGFDVAWTSLVRNSLSNTQLKTPLWIPQGLWFLGMAFFSLTLLLLIIRSTQAWLARDYEWLRHNVGARSIEEDAAAETGYAEVSGLGNRREPQRVRP